MKRIFVPLILLLLVSTLSRAQDPHFTQYFATPQLLNPANIGFVPGKYRASLIHRDQWRGILDRSYTSSSANFDIELTSPFGVATKDRIGIGLSFLNDHVGLIDLNTNSMILGLAFHKFLSKNGNQYLRAGFQFSINQRNLTFSNLFFSDQFDGVSAYNLGTLETLPENIRSYANLNLGLLYTADVNDNFAVNAGVAIHNLTSPDITFFDPTVGDSSTAEIFQRFSFQLSTRMGIGQNGFALIPRVLYNIQGPYSRLNTGLNLRIPISDDNYYAVQLGGWLRMAQASENLARESLIALVAFELKSFNLGFSYDMDLKEVSGTGIGHNAFEVSVSYIGLFKEDFVFCPQF